MEYEFVYPNEDKFIEKMRAEKRFGDPYKPKNAKDDHLAKVIQRMATAKANFKQALQQQGWVGKLQSAFQKPTQPIDIQAAAKELLDSALNASQLLQHGAFSEEQYRTLLRIWYDTEEYYSKYASKYYK